MTRTLRLSLGTALLSSFSVASAQFSFRFMDDAALGRPDGMQFFSSSLFGMSADGNRIAYGATGFVPGGIGLELRDKIGYLSRSGSVWNRTDLVGFDFLHHKSLTDHGSEYSAPYRSISGDGRTIVGSLDWDEDNAPDQELWRDRPTIFSPSRIKLQTPDDTSHRLIAVSGDGSTILGRGYYDYALWRNGALVPLTFPAFMDNVQPFGVSPDGTTLVGTYSSVASGTGPYPGFRSTGGLVTVLSVPDGWKYVRPIGLSADNRVAFGYVMDEGGARAAFAHTADGGMRLLAGPFNTESQMHGSNADGSVFVGLGGLRTGQTMGFVWTDWSGPIALTNYLVENGVDLGGGYIGTADHISADGKTVSGYVYRPDPTNGQQRRFIYVAKIELPQGLVSVRSNTPSVVGGNSHKMWVNLFKGSTTGDEVHLASSDPDVLPVPATVAVAAGGKVGTFYSNTAGVSAPTSVTVTATWGQVQQKVTVNVMPASLKEMRTEYVGAPDPLQAGKGGNLLLLLDGKAPMGGAKVNLWDNSTLISFPAPESSAVEVTVPEGQTFLRVPFTTKASADALTKILYGRMPGGPRLQTTLSLQPWYAPISFNVLPSKKIVGGQSATGRVRLNLPGGAAGQVVHIESGSNLVTIPSTVVVGPTDTADFTISTSVVAKPVNTWIRVSLGGTTRSASIRIDPQP